MMRSSPSTEKNRFTGMSKGKRIIKIEPHVDQLENKEQRSAEIAMLATRWKIFHRY